MIDLVGNKKQISIGGVLSLLFKIFLWGIMGSLIGGIILYLIFYQGKLELLDNPELHKVYLRKIVYAERNILSPLLLSVFVVSGFRNKLVDVKIGFGKKNALRLVYVFFLSIFMLFLLSPFYNLSGIIDLFSEFKVSVPKYILTKETYDLLLLSSTGLFVPIIEEILIREIIQKRLQYVYSSFVSICVSAGFFMLLHLFAFELVLNSSYLLGVFLFGFIQGIIFHSTKNVTYNIIIHSIWNFYCLLFDSESTDVSVGVISVIVIAYMFLFKISILIIKKLKSESDVRVNN